jgi:hypothetical protein
MLKPLFQDPEKRLWLVVATVAALTLSVILLVIALFHGGGS